MMNGTFGGKAMGMKTLREIKEKQEEENENAQYQNVSPLTNKSKSIVLNQIVSRGRDKMSGFEKMLNTKKEELGYSGFDKMLNIKPNTDGFSGFDKMLSKKNIENNERSPTKILGTGHSTEFNPQSYLQTNKKMKSKTMDVNKYLRMDNNKDSNVHKIIGTSLHNKVTMGNTQNKINNMLGRGNNNIKMFGVGKNKNRNKYVQKMLGTSTNKNNSTTKKIGLITGNNMQNKINQMIGGNIQNKTKQLVGGNMQNKVNKLLGRNPKKDINSKNMMSTKIGLGINPQEKINKMTNGFGGNNFRNELIRGKTPMTPIGAELTGWNRMKQQKGLSLWGDRDGDGVKNILDCNPLNKMLQGPGDKNSNMEEELEPYVEGAIDATEDLAVEEIGEDSGYENPEINTGSNDIGSGVDMVIDNAEKHASGGADDVQEAINEDILQDEETVKEEKEGFGQKVGRAVRSTGEYIGKGVSNVGKGVAGVAKEILEPTYKEETEIRKTKKGKPKTITKRRRVSTAERLYKGIEEGGKTFAKGFETAVPGNLPSRTRDLIGGSSSLAGARALLTPNSSWSFGTKAALVTGGGYGREDPLSKLRYVGQKQSTGTDPFYLKVAQTLGKKEDLKKALKIREEELNALSGDSENIETQPAPRPAPTPQVQRPQFFEQPVQQTTQGTTPDGRTPPRPPTAAEIAEGKLTWSYKSDRYVKYPRDPYDKDKRKIEYYEPQQSMQEQY